MPLCVLRVLGEKTAVRIGVCVPFAPLAPLASTGSKDWVAALLPCVLCGKKSGTSTVWKKFSTAWITFSMLWKNGRKSFHGVEVPDFLKGRGCGLPVQKAKAGQSL
jgi:hypothetical protein